MMHSGRGRTAFLLALLVISLLSVDGFGAMAAAISKSAYPQSVSLCVGGAPGIFPLLAHENGAFAAEGVTVNLKKYVTTTEGLEHFFKGECEMSSISETAIVMKSLEQRDFSILATYATSDNSAFLLASRKSGINSPKDLRGKRIFVPQWSSNHFFLDMFLARHGMSEKDITLVVSGMPDIAAAFAAGRVDAYCASEVAIDKPRRALGKNAVVFEAPGLCLASYHLAAKKDFIQSRPELIRKVLSALLRNEEWVRMNRAAAVRAAAAALNMEERVMEGIWGKHRWKVELSQTLLIQLEQEARWAITSGYTRRKSIPNYLDYVYRQGLLALKPEVVSILP